jgi:hypothetical protein
VKGYTKLSDLGPFARGRFDDLEAQRERIARDLSKLLDPKNKLGRWSPHYLPLLRDLLATEMRIDGLKFALDLEHPE